MPYHVTTILGKAKNHAIAEDACIIAEVHGGGYPIGEGWSPHTEDKTHEIVRKLNEHEAKDALIKELAEALNEAYGCMCHFQYCAGPGRILIRQQMEATKAVLAKLNHAGKE